MLQDALQDEESVTTGPLVVSGPTPAKCCRTWIKQTGAGERVYNYYQCTYYNAPGHPRTRVTEADLDRQVSAIFHKMRIEEDAVRDWFRDVLASPTRDEQSESLAQAAELNRQWGLIVNQQDRLVNLRIANEIDEVTFVRKQTELRDRLAAINLQRDLLTRSHDETAKFGGESF